jgi:hypothetical protein
MQSETIGKLALALSKAQLRITGALSDSSNPFFKSKYADLASVMDAIRIPFAENELAVSQMTSELEGKIYLNTILMHSSGEFLKSTYPVSVKDYSNPQVIGSGITYARRYALAAIAGVAQVDDDSNAVVSSLKANSKPALPAAKLPPPEDDLNDFFDDPNPRPVIATAQSAAYPANTQKKVVSEAQLKRLYAIQNKSTMSNEDVSKMIKLRFGKISSKDLTNSEYQDLITVIEATIIN